MIFPRTNYPRGHCGGPEDLAMGDTGSRKAAPSFESSYPCQLLGLHFGRFDDQLVVPAEDRHHDVPDRVHPDKAVTLRDNSTANSPTTAA
jgi:hypothetical protein